VPPYPVVPALGALFSFALIGFMTLQQILLAAGLVLGGVIWYFVYVRKRVDDTSALGQYRSPPEMEVEVDLDSEAPATEGVGADG